jgi:nicotinate-nucleotide adenylyltransferase
MRLGLFGGSFDPVHLGHHLVAQAALEEMKLDRVFFIPAAQSPFKPGTNPAPARQRVQMLRLALAGESQFEVDEQEICRGGVSYTIDTVREFHRRFPEAALFYLIGTDHVPQLPKWRDAEELAKMVQFIVIPRPDQEARCVPAPFEGRILTGFPLAVSSSDIRTRVRQGLSVKSLVRREVAEVIQNNRLYL